LTHAPRERYTGRVPAGEQPARKRSTPATRAVYAVFVALAAAFIVSSTVQIAQEVFAEPGPSGDAPGAVAPACAAGLRTLASAVDRGLAAAGAASDAADAERRYRAARSPEWDPARQQELVRPCEGDAHGVAAIAAMARLDRAAEGAVQRRSDELGPVRRAALSFIR
jgi:hypothetical protein